MIAAALGPLKGDLPMSSSYITAPSDHMSAAAPLYSCRVRTSGAVNSIVPQVSVRLPI